MQVLAQITLNFQQPNFVTVYAAQNDRLSRFINATLLDGATPWTFPTGALMTIRYRKPDGTSGWYDTLEDGSPAYTVEEDGSIIFGLAEQALTVPGMVPVELNFYNAAGAKLSTLTFIVAVKPSAYSDEDIASSDYYNILTAKMQQLAELADSAEGDYQEYLSALSGFVGAPRTAAVAADMLDTGLIYVYTGSETGWTYGDWYYYNGREWTSGGVYNSAAISLDDTLTNANKPAQAKAAGDLVLVQDTQPAATVNKLWFPLTEPTDEQVPTWDEFSELKSSINSLERYEYTDSDLTTDNSYIRISDGALGTDSTNFHSSKLITIPRNATKIRINKSGEMTGGAVVAFYTGYKFSSTTFISGITVPNASALPIDINIPSNAVYMAFTGRKNNEFDAVLNTNKVAVFVENAKHGTQLELTAGSVGVDGSITYGQTTISNYISQLLHKTDFQSVRIVPHRGYQCNYALFNDGTFVSRGTWMGSNSVLNIDNAYDCILMFASEITESKTAEQMLLEYDTQIIEGSELQTVYNNLKNAENRNKLFAEKVLSSALCGKVIHYSLDDSYRALRRLITEEDTYTSIFDNYIFNKLKTVHDQTGAKFTMNVILDIEDFDITLVPTKFMSDFQANKDWLKFAYHDVDGDHSETTYDAMSTAYQTFVSNVYRFTGTYDCIDTMPRLDSFSGNLSVVKALQDNANAPIVGLLSADDVRNSYYLSSAQSAIARNKGKYFDYDNSMVFIRSETRLDSASAEDLIAEIEANPCYQSFVEVWFHEGLVGDPSAEKLLTIGTWASSKGYNNYYPYKIFTF